MALMTGFDPSRTCIYMFMGRVACNPTRKMVEMNTD